MDKAKKKKKEQKKQQQMEEGGGEWERERGRETGTKSNGDWQSRNSKNGKQREIKDHDNNSNNNDDDSKTK